ncbi:MAG: hypothetical protein MJ211_08760 [Bacteroidales bacterium]|nr:hypothetical protein [Bacteroidales bacterium]
MRSSKFNLLIQKITNKFFSVVLTFICIVFFNFNSKAQVNLIYDTEFGNDIDKLGALLLINNFIDSNECNLLGVVCSSSSKSSLHSLHLVNSFCNHNNIPIVESRCQEKSATSNFADIIAVDNSISFTDNFFNNSTIMYRKLLASAQDKSVTIIVSANLSSLDALLKSPGDKNSPLTGFQLVRKKVNEVIIVGGIFPSGFGNWHVYDSQYSFIAKVIKKLSIVNVTYIGYELGKSLQSGTIVNSFNKDNYIYECYNHFSKYSLWTKQRYMGEILNTNSSDQIAVLYAVRNYIGSFWRRKDGKCLVNNDGTNKWKPSTKSNQSYLELFTDPENIVNEINNELLKYNK